MVRDRFVQTVRCGCSGLSVVLALASSVLWAQANLKPEEQAAIVLNAANKAFNEKQLSVAVERYREYLQKFANQKEATNARYGLGLALLESNPRDFKNAVEVLGQAAGVADFADRPLVLYQLAVAYRGLGTEALQQAIAKPNEANQFKAQALPHFAQAALRFGEAHAALVARAKTAAPPPANELPADIEWATRARCDQAEMLLRQDKAKEAGEVLVSLLAEPTTAKSRYRPLALYFHGQSAFLLKDFPSALRSLAQLAPFTDPVFGAHAQYLLARTHHLLEERAEAAARYEAVTTGYEKLKVAAQQQLQNAAAMQNQPEERARLEAFIKVPPDYVVRSQFYWAVLMQEQQKPSEALTRLTAFLQQQPQSPLADEARLRQAMAQVELRQFPPAIQTLQPLIAHATLADRALLWLARAQLNSADPAQPQPYAQALNVAIGHLSQAADRANQRVAQEPEAKARRGEILLELGDYQQLARQFPQAATTYEQGFKDNITPQRNEEFLQRRATALHLAGQFDASDQACTQFQQAFPKSTLLSAVLFRSAENAYLRAAAIDPAQTPAKNADLAKWLGEAANRYKALLEKYPEFPYASLARFRWALTFYRQDDFVQALKLLAGIPAADHQGELATAPYYQADCLLRALPTDSGDALAAARQIQSLAEAIKLLESFVGGQGNDPQKALPQTADALLKLGYCYQKTAAQLVEPAERNQKLTAARQAFERIGQQFGASAAAPIAVLERANCLIEANDIGGAQNELNRFKADPLKSSPVAPLAYLRLATLLRAQNKAADAAQLLQEGRNQYEGALAGDPQRAAWASLLAYQHALAVKETGKLSDAQKLFEAVAQKYAASAEAAESVWRAGQCRREEAQARYTAAQAALVKPGAKPEELTAANQQTQESVKSLSDTGGYLAQQAGQLAAKAAGSDTHQRMLYEAAWCYQTVADFEMEAARRKLADEALKKWQEQQAKTQSAAPAATPPAGLIGLQNVPQQRLPEIPIAAVAKQPAEELARTQYRTLVASRSDSPLSILGRLELAEMMAQREEWDPAIALLDDALSIEPAPEVEEKIRLRLGVCLIAKNDPAKAFQQFATVAQNVKSPLMAEARYRAGECQMLQKQWAKAIEMWIPFRDQQPLQNVPNLSDRALLRLGHACALATQWDQSRQAMEVLLQRFPQSPWRFEARYGIGWALQNQRQFDQAANQYQQVINETATEVAAKSQYQLAMCRSDQKRLPEAANALLVVPFTYDYPQWSAVALLEAARVFQDMNQAPQARRILERVLKEFPETDWSKAAQQRLTQLQTGAGK